MTDSLTPEGQEESPASEPSTLITTASPALDPGTEHAAARAVIPSPLGDAPVSARSPNYDGSSLPPESVGGRKTRPKMTLRIPDDEVARPSRPIPSPGPPVAASSGAVVRPSSPPPALPNPAPPPSLSPSPPPSKAGQVRPDRIISLRVDTPTNQIASTPLAAPTAQPATVTPARPESVALPPTVEDTSPEGKRAPSVRPPPPPPYAVPPLLEEDSWTPFQPMTVDHPPPDSSLSVDVAFEQDLPGRVAVMPAPPAAEPPRAVPAVAPVAPSPLRVSPSGPAAPALAAAEGSFPAAAPTTPMFPIPAPADSAAPTPAPLGPPRPQAFTTPGIQAEPPVAPRPLTLLTRPAPAASAPPVAPEGAIPEGPDGFPEMVFDDQLFPSSRRPTFETKEAPPPAPPQKSEPPVSVVEAEEEETATPPVPPPPAVAPPLPPRPRAVSAAELDIQVELEPPAPSEPVVSSEPTEAAEISPEDVVSVEAVDKARTPSVPPPPMRARATSSPSFNPTPAVPSKPPARVSTPALSTATVRTSTPPEHVAAPPAKARPMVIVPGASPLAPPPMTEASSAARKRVRPWWEDLFNDDFIRTMAKITDRQIAREVDFIEESLGLDKGAMVLDLACGTGRHAIELTRRGYQVVGFDLSLAMLAKAADEAQDRDQKLNFVQGDMREMTFDGTFDGVYCWSTSFGYFEEEKNAAVIDAVWRALKPGGQVLLDVENRDFVAAQCPSMAWFEGDGCVCMDDMNIDWITSRMRVKRTMMMDDGRSREIEYSIRLYSLHELGKLLHEHGFRVVQASGRIATPGVFLGADSPRTLILAEKK